MPGTAKETVDRIPATAIEAANAAISWRDLDATLARLTADSGRELSHLRGEQPRRGWIRVVVVSAAGADARIATEWFRA